MATAVAEPVPASAAAPKRRPLPGRRDDLVVRPVAGNQYVIKDPVTEAYFQIGEQEWFLLSQLDATATSSSVLNAFEAKFGEELSSEDLNDFIEMVSQRHLLKDKAGTRPRSKSYVDSEDENWNDASAGSGKKSRQSILYWRYNLFDPDRLFNRVEPLLRWVWTLEFFVVSCIAITAAGAELWAHRLSFLAAFPQAMRWETFAFVWFTLIVATICHEFAHGLTCKHHGGEVHEVGFLMMFFTPCLYCNVSDAWLIPSKWHRLWVTLAGAWCDLCIWALATFVWRLTVMDSFVNYLASVVLSVCGARVFMNFNPLLKLDGYYLLSDWLEIPNLRGRSWERWLGWLRCVLWGAPRPPPAPRDFAVTLYGMISWTFSLMFLIFVFVNVTRLAQSRGGLIGVAIALFLATFTIKRLFRGFNGGEVRKMITGRPIRIAMWLTLLIAVPLVMGAVRIDERAGGTFHVRTGKRLEVRAEVAGFLKEVQFDEGDKVSSGALVARIEVPDLQSLITQKAAEVREVQANLQRLEIGSRPEEVQEQRAKVDRARQWRDLAVKDLERAQQGLKEELARFDQQITLHQAEVAFAQQSVTISERLYRKGVLAGEQLRSEKKKVQMAEGLLQQALSQKRTREASGNLQFEAELAKRVKDLADTEASLALLTAGARPQEIEAERARLEKFQEELDYNRDLQSKQVLRSTLTGFVTTPRLREKVGQFLEKGTLICTIEDLTSLEAEIDIPEDKMEGVQVGQTINLKARAFPLQTFTGRVDRIAPIATAAAEGTAAAAGQQGTVTVYCRVDNPESQLRSGMSGYGRIYRGQQTLRSMAGMQILRYVRTEFWW